MFGHKLVGKSDGCNRVLSVLWSVGVACAIDWLAVSE